MSIIIPFHFGDAIVVDGIHSLDSNSCDFSVREGDGKQLGLSRWGGGQEKKEKNYSQPCILFYSEKT